MPNLLAELPAAAENEHFEVLLSQPGARIERIVSYGQSSPPGFWYDQEEHEWVLLLKGKAQLEYEDRVLDLKVGDSVYLPAHTKHRVAWTDPQEATVWLAVFFPSQELVSPD